MQDEELDQPLRTIVKLVRKVAEWNSGGEDEEKRNEKQRPTEEQRKKAREHLRKYNPQVPGKVVYVYRCDAAFLPLNTQMMHETCMFIPLNMRTP